MDATQAINDPLFESDEEGSEEKPNKGRQPLAKLCILKNEHVPEREFPLFMGDNVLGRDVGTCTLPLLAPSVSKQHATIRISVHQRRGSRSGVDIEAVIRDLGSMNGTRIGRVKLIPNISYPLSEGNRLFMADMPCQYLSINDAREDVGDRTSGVSVSLTGDSIEKRDGLKVSASQLLQASPLGKVEKPAQNSCLSIETAPVQLQRILVPESESDSDGERPRNRESRRKLQGSDSSPTCSTFLSPTNKIVPESPLCEDETLITPSSSTRETPHRHVRFSKEEPDVDVGGQHKKDTLAFVNGSNAEEAGAVENGQTRERQDCVLEQLKNQASFTEEKLSQLSTSTVSPRDIPKLNMDSDTDMEEDSGEAQPAPNQIADAVGFLMDSDTDVDEDDAGDASAPPAQPKGGDSHPDMSPDAIKADVAPPLLPDDFQLDSDTDVDEQAGDTSRDSAPSRLAYIGDVSESDDNRALSLTTQSNVSDSAAGSNNSNGVREHPHSSPVATTPSSATPGIMEAAAHSESDAANTDVDESSSPPADRDSDTDAEEEKNAITHPGIKQCGIQSPLLQNCSTPLQLSGGYNSAVRSAAFSPCLDSLEDEDFVVAETQSFILQNQGSIQSRNNDTNQASVSESSGEDKGKLPRGEASFQLGLSDSSHLQSATQALAMESTQAFVMDTQAYASTSSADTASLGNDLNIEATQAYEAYQAPASSPVLLERSRKVNLALQETQTYISESSSESEKEPKEDTETQPFDFPTSSSLALAETQLMTAFQEEERPTTNGSVASLELNQIANKTNSSTGHGEAETDFVAPTVAESQPRCVREADETSAKQPHLEEATQRSTSVDIVKKQPVAASQMEDTKGEDPIQVLPKRKVQFDEVMQPITSSYRLDANCQPMSLAETQPLAASETEESDDENAIPVLVEGNVQPDQEMQPMMSSDPFAADHQLLSLATTHPMAASEIEESDDDDSVPVLDEGKVQLDKEMQPGVSSYGLTANNQPLSRVSTQLMVLNKNEETDCKNSIEVAHESKVQSNKENQPSMSSYVLPVATQPLATNEESDDEDLIPYLHERKVQLDKERQLNTISNSPPSIAPTQPMATSENEETDVEDSIEVLHASKVQLNKETQPNASSSTVTTQPVSIAATQPMATSDNEESDEEDSIVVLRSNRKAMPLQIEETQSLNSTLELLSTHEPNPRAQRSQSQVGTSIRPSITVENSRGTPSQLRAKDEPREKRQRRSKMRKSSPAGSELEKEATRQQTDLLEVLDEKKERRRGRNAPRGKKQREETELSQAAEGRERHERLETEAQQQTRDKAEKALPQNKEEKPEATQRGRRGTRRAIAALPLAAPSQDDVPAKRTRLRSNSVTSEVSTSSVRESRSRGAKTSNGSVTRQPSEQDSRSTSPLGALSRSSSSISLASDMSCSSLGSRRGRQRGSGRKMEPGPSLTPPVFSQSPAAKPTTRGQRGKKADVSFTELSDEIEKKPKSKPATRGRSQANVKATSNAEPSNTAGESPLPKRNTRGRGQKNPEEENPVPVQAKRRAKASCAPGNRNAKESTPDIDGEGAKATSVEGSGEGAQPQSAISSKRKMRDASVKSSPGTSRNSSASVSLSRRSRDASHVYKVLFTGVVDEPGKRALTRLGGFLATGTADMNCLVTDKVRRTVKFICAVAKGIPIVNIHWLHKSDKAGTLLPPDGFFVSDAEQEEKFNFRLQETLSFASSHPLLQGYKIHITKSVKPEPLQMRDIVLCSGATFLARMPSSHKPHTVVISCPEDLPLCRAAISASLPVVSAEFLLSGILQHKVDFDAHKLSGPPQQPDDGRKRRRRKI